MKKEILKDIYINTISSKDGSRGKERQDLLHSYLAREIKNNIDQEKFLVQFGNREIDMKEYKYEGPLFDKDTDIVILDKISKTLISALPIKFVFSNYMQNWKNYHEQMVAEALNLKLNGINVYNIVIVRDNTPYFTKDKKSIKKIEQPLSNGNVKTQYERFANFKKGQLSDGIMYSLVDYNDVEINKKFVKSPISDWNSYSKELIDNLNTEDIKVTFPLKDEFLNSFDWDGLITKIVNDLEFSNKRMIKLQMENRLFTCPVCKKDYRLAMDLKTHEDCIISVEERKPIIEDYFKNLKFE